MNPDHNPTPDEAIHHLTDEDIEQAIESMSAALREKYEAEREANQQHPVWRANNDLVQEYKLSRDDAHIMTKLLELREGMTDEWTLGRDLARAIAKNESISPKASDILVVLSADHSLDLESDLAGSQNLTLDQQLHFASSEDRFTRFAIAHNRTVRTAVLEAMAPTEDDDDVVCQILWSPACTPAVRALMDEAVVEQVDAELAGLICEVADYCIHENDWELFEVGVHPSIDLAAVLNCTLPKQIAHEYADKPGVVGEVALARLGAMAYDFQQVEGWELDDDEDDED